MSADEWLARHLDLAAQHSAGLRERYGLSQEKRIEPTGRYGGLTWLGPASFVSFFADVWETYEAVHIGVVEGGAPPHIDTWLPANLTCVALRLVPPTVLSSPSREDREAGLPEWLGLQVNLIATHLGPIMQGDRAFSAKARLAVDAYTSQPDWRLLGR